MSQENVELVEHAYAHFERGDFWLQDVFDSHVRVTWPIDIITGGRESVGVEQFAQDMILWLEPWKGVTVTAERIIDAGDQVVVIGVMARAGQSVGRGRRMASRSGLDHPGREGSSLGGIRRSRRGPRSRGAAGVGALSLL
jgi:ketosteroid isomerase-like protein